MRNLLTPTTGKDRRFVRFNGASRPAIETFEPRLLLSAGLFDPTFGVEGIAQLQVQPLQSSPYVVVRPNGNIVKLGDDGQTTYIAEFNADGSVNPHFGNQGLSAIFPRSGLISNGMALGSDGKIVIIGKVQYDTVGQQWNMRLVRLNVDGTIDYTFSTTGYISLGSLSYPNAQVAVQPDGKVLADLSDFGSSFMPSQNAPEVLRFNANGTPDASFGRNGISIVRLDPADAAPGEESLTGIVRQPNGTIVLTGATADNAKGAIARLTASGTPDLGFGNNGIVLVDKPPGVGSSMNITASLPRPDGRIVAMAYTPFQSEVIGLTASGAMDGTFANGGVAIVPRSDFGMPATLLPDGSLVVLNNGILLKLNSRGVVDDSFANPQAGVQNAGASIALQRGKVLLSGSQGLLARFNLDGTPDASFGVGGVIKPLDPNLNRGEYRDSLPLSDGRVLVTGWTYDANDKSILQLARFLADGTLDRAFGRGGRITTSAGGVTIGYRLALGPNGSIIVGGDKAILRFTANGALDTTFGQGGVAKTSSAVQNLTIQSGGKIVYCDKDSVYCVNPNGMPDTSFGKAGTINLVQLLKNTAGKNVVSGFIDFRMVDLLMQGSRIVVACSISVPNLQFQPEVVVSHPCLLRLNANGTLDTNFGAKGVAMLTVADRDIVASTPQAARVHFLPDGTLGLLIVSSSVSESTISYVLAIGVVSATGTPMGIHRLIEARQVSNADFALEPDGRLVLYYGAPDGHVIRFKRDYTYDTTFGGTDNGRLQLDTAEEYSYFGNARLAIASDGRIYLAGWGNFRPTLGVLAAKIPAPSAVLLADGMLFIGATDGPDTITIDHVASNIIATINGKQIGSFSASVVKGIWVSAQNGNDIVTENAANTPATLAGGAGDDILTGGNQSVSLYGGDNNDLLRPGHGAGSYVRGGSGQDTIDYSTESRGVEIHLDNLTDSGHSGEHDNLGIDIEIVLGTQYADTIFASNFGGRYYGLGGDDTLIGGDTAMGSFNGGTWRNDVTPSALYGGDGNDLILALNFVADTIEGGAGDDVAHVDTGTIADVVTNIEKFGSTPPPPSK